MRKGLVLTIVLVMVMSAMFISLIGCSKESSEGGILAGSKRDDTVITIKRKDQTYVTRFKTEDKKFKFDYEAEKLYNKVTCDDLGIYMMFVYDEMTKEQYDINKNYNFLGEKKEVEEFTWNGYSAYADRFEDVEVRIIILLKEQDGNVLVLRMNVEYDGDDSINVIEAFKSQEVQNFLNTMEFVEE